MISLFWKKHPIVLPPSRHPLSSDLIDKSVMDILNRLRRYEFQACLVGGCVRDILLRKKPKDFDIATNARPQQIKRLFRRCYLIGKRFRLAHVYISRDRFVEVATFRSAALPNQAQAGRYAANNVYGTIEEDALRRDFTVNSLYYNREDSTIIDYTGGLRDLKKRLVRSIGDPATRFAEDPVRIIRAARFCAQLGFKMSTRDFKAASESASLIKEANGHRLLEELYKILRCGASAETILNLKKFRILQFWLPELIAQRHEGPIFRRLSAVDIRRNRGEDIPNAVLVTTLLFDLFSEAMNTSAARGGFQEAFTALNNYFGEMASRIYLPRREWDAVCNIASRYRTFVRTSSGRRAKGAERRFVHNAHFPNAFQFFEILVDATGEHKDRLEYWRSRAAGLLKEPRHGAGERKGEVKI
jgi:poly(A) polymerase